MRRAQIAMVTSSLRDLFTPLVWDHYSEIQALGANKAHRGDKSAQRVYKPRTDNNQFSAHNVEDDAAVHQLVDVIVRHKYLELAHQHQQQSAVDSAATAPKSGAVLTKLNWKEAAKQERHLCEQCNMLNLHVEELPRLVRDIELLIVAARKKTAEEAPTTWTESLSVEERLKCLLPNSKLAFYSSPNNRALELLLANLQLVEQEYKQQLGFEITEQHAEHIVGTYNREVFWRGVYSTTVAVSAVAMAAVTLSSVFQK